mmetsp:Transcript_14299/g.26546  ORF Transcript_14299/g.26546 Transcript_14299/m.26546 type:complete len:408 (-) Transcript_14299:94-1317(-)
MASVANAWFIRKGRETQPALCVTGFLLPCTSKKKLMASVANALRSPPAWLALLFLGSCSMGPTLVSARLGNSAVSLNSDNFEAFVRDNDKVLVDFYDLQDPEWRQGQSELDKAIRTVRGAGSKLPIAKVDAAKDKDLAKKFVKNGRYPQLMWFQHGHPTQYHRTLRKAQQIVDFVMALDRDPVIVVKSEEEARDFVPAVFAQVRKSSPMYKLLEVVALKHMDQVAFAFLESSKDNITWLSNETHVQYKGAATADALDRWVRTNSVRSEPVPEDPSLLEDEGSRVIVGKTFEDTVLQPDRDVMVLVHAPWCGFCKKFMPVWDQFRSEVADVSHLVVAKMDGSRNGSPLPEDFTWESYPKVFYVKAGTKTPVVFGGNRTVDNLIDFVKEHSTKPVQLGKEANPEKAVDL